MSENPVDLRTLSIGLLVGRVVIGLLMSAHGAQKLFGWFGGHGLHTTGEFMVRLGFSNGPIFAAAAGMAEVGSGLLVATGFLGPIGPALMISVMIVAIVTVHWKNGLFATKSGIELPLLYAMSAMVFAVAGYGAYSLDTAFGIAGRWSTTITWIALGVGVVGGLSNAALRRRSMAGA